MAYLVGGLGPAVDCNSLMMMMMMMKQAFDCNLTLMLSDDAVEDGEYGRSYKTGIIFALLCIFVLTKA